MRIRLVDKGIEIDPMFPVCELAPETAIHSLLLCPFAQAVWFAYPFGLRIAGSQVGTIGQFLEEVVFVADARVLLCVASIMKALWGCRNKVFFDGGQAKVDDVLHRVAWLMEAPPEELVASSSAILPTRWLLSNG